MSDMFDSRPIPSSDALTSRVGDETVILQVRTGAYFGLDPVATRIWNLIEEGVAPAAICDRLALEYDVGRDVIEADVRALLAELKSHEIINEGRSPPAA